MMHLNISTEIQNELQGNDAELFQQIMSLTGQVFRALEGRCTLRVELNGKGYFLKRHLGIGWKEIFKNLFQLKLPISSAKNEWEAIQHLQQLQIPTMQIVGYGKKGWNPAKIQSFLLTKELTDKISLEEFTQDWDKKPPNFALKYSLIKEVARITRKMHDSGMNHRDYYICHLLLDKLDQHSLYLIDLHRAQIRNKTPVRWLLKDLAGLYFSCKDRSFTARDLFRFIREYRQQPLRRELREERKFWEKVKKRGDKLYQRHGRQTN